jgi:hypothetical protein
MLSDILFDAECAIRRYQSDSSDTYRRRSEQINQLRCQMIILRMELDCTDPQLLDGNPIYEACKRGDPSLHDRHIEGDDAIIDEWIENVKAMRRVATENQGK